MHLGAAGHQSVSGYFPRTDFFFFPKSGFILSHLIEPQAAFACHLVPVRQDLYGNFPPAASPKMSLTEGKLGLADKNKLKKRPQREGSEASCSPEELSPAFTPLSPVLSAARIDLPPPPRHPRPRHFPAKPSQGRPRLLALLRTLPLPPPETSPSQGRPGENRGTRQPASATYHVAGPPPSSSSSFPADGGSLPRAEGGRAGWVRQRERARHPHVPAPVAASGEEAGRSAGEVLRAHSGRGKTVQS